MNKRKISQQNALYFVCDEVVSTTEPIVKLFKSRPPLQISSWMIAKACGHLTPFPRKKKKVITKKKRGALAGVKVHSKCRASLCSFTISH